MASRIKNKDLKKRIIELSFKHHLSHIGSCLGSVDTIDEIYGKMNLETDRFILSAGHAGLALYVVLEKYLNVNAEELLVKHGIHPNRDVENGIWGSTGSLGHGLGMSLGMALANETGKVFCLASDGEMMEGSCFEALRIANELEPTNLKVWIVCNGYGAYGEIDTSSISDMCALFPTLNVIAVNTRKAIKPFEVIEGLKEQSAHYHVLDEAQYNTLLMRVLK